MADASENPELKEKPSEAPKAPQKPSETPQALGQQRGEVARTLAEGGEAAGEAGEGVTETGEVRETISEGPSETKGAGMGQKKKDDDQGDAAKAAQASGQFIFDASNLPPAPKMIKMIEDQLRTDIKDLSKIAKGFKPSFWKDGDMPKYSDTVREIRQKNVLLKRLFTLAYDVLKKMFIQMFGSKKPS